MQQRKVTEAEAAAACIAASLTAARLAHEACEDPRVKDLAYCSCYWKLVFIDQFKEAPTGNEDPRWDLLFAQGFRILRILDGSHIP